METAAWILAEVVKTLVSGNQAATIGAIAAASVVGAPALEELTYRGFLLPSLTKWMPTPAAVRTLISPQLCTVCCSPMFTVTRFHTLQAPAAPLAGLATSSLWLRVRVQPMRPEGLLSCKCISRA